MRNRIQILVRLMNGADLQRNVFSVPERLYVVVEKVKRKYHAPYPRWIDKRINNFYSMIKNYKK